MAGKDLSPKNQLFVESEIKEQKADLNKDQKPKQTFGLDEAFKASLKYFGGDELAARVWVNKYALKDSNGALYELTPDDMHRRLASEIGRDKILLPRGRQTRPDSPEEVSMIPQAPAADTAEASCERAIQPIGA